MITTLSQLIALVESNNDPSALRFEPNWQYVTPALIAQCKQSHSAFMNDTTAKTLMSFSYGKYQNMGSVLYEMGYKGTLNNFATNTTLQDAWFETFITRRSIVYTLDEVTSNQAIREHFAITYNGSVDYALKMMDVYARVNHGQ